jgi:hypothetical protein
MKSGKRRRLWGPREGTISKNPNRTKIKSRKSKKLEKRNPKNRGIVFPLR